jgi:hypothetical protein
MKLNTTLFASLSIAFSIVLSSFLLLSIEHEQHAPIPSSGGTRYLQKGEEDESEDGIFNSLNSEEVVEFVLNY